MVESQKPKKQGGLLKRILSLSKLMKSILLFLIRGYQLVLSPLMGSNCRYYPTCSCYTHEAIEKHGAFKGMWLGIKRISRCHPWAAGGYDPVPENSSDKKDKLS